MATPKQILIALIRSVDDNEFPPNEYFSLVLEVEEWSTLLEVSRHLPPSFTKAGLAMLITLVNRLNDILPRAIPYIHDLQTLERIRSAVADYHEQLGTVPEAITTNPQSLARIRSAMTEVHHRLGNTPDDIVTPLVTARIQAVLPGAIDETTDWQRLIDLHRRYPYSSDLIVERIATVLTKLLKACRQPEEVTRMYADVTRFGNTWHPLLSPSTHGARRGEGVHVILSRIRAKVVRFPTKRLIGHWHDSSLNDETTEMIASCIAERLAGEVPDFKQLVALSDKLAITDKARWQPAFGEAFARALSGFGFGDLCKLRSSTPPTSAAQDYVEYEFDVGWSEWRVDPIYYSLPHHAIDHRLQTILNTVHDRKELAQLQRLAEDDDTRRMIASRRSELTEPLIHHMDSVSELWSLLYYQGCASALPRLLMLLRDPNKRRDFTDLSVLMRLLEYVSRTDSVPNKEELCATIVETAGSLIKEVDNAQTLSETYWHQYPALYKDVLLRLRELFDAEIEQVVAPEEVREYWLRLFRYGRHGEERDREIRRFTRYIAQRVAALTAKRR